MQPGQLLLGEEMELRLQGLRRLEDRPDHQMDIAGQALDLIAERCVAAAAESASHTCEQAS